MALQSPQTTLEQIAKAGHVPAVSYGAVSLEAGKEGVQKDSVAVGKKDASTNPVSDTTRFPASSLSKVVFTYLVLQMVKDKKIDLDEPLHKILPNERFKVDGEYPAKAKELTARHVLSHTTGLPNLGGGLTSELKFNDNSELGEGYSYSGEAFLYLQQALEHKTGKNLEELAQEYVFGPLGMEHSTFSPPSESDSDVVKVHTELGKPTPIYVGEPKLNAAGSLLTTGDDFAKFMAAWLENMDDPIMKQAFETANAYKPNETCGLGWHIYKDKGDTIAYQFGENPNTRAFVAINLTQRKGAAFFTNSENGMSIANQVFTSPDLTPIANMQEVYQKLHYTQSDEPGWQETIAGKVAEAEGRFDDARQHFEKALEAAPDDGDKKLRLQWFNEAHNESQQQTFQLPLRDLVGKYNNPYEEVDISIKGGNLIYKQSGNEIKLTRISETEFVPEKDQEFKLVIDSGKISLESIHGFEKSFTRQPTPQSQMRASLMQYRESCQEEQEEQKLSSPQPPRTP